MTDADVQGQGPYAILEELWSRVPADYLALLRERLHVEASDVMRQFGTDPQAEVADAGFLKMKYHQAVLATLVAATQPIWPELFEGNGILDDLIQIVADSGRPRILWTESPNPDKRIKEAARKNFILGVIYRAARERISRVRVLDQLGSNIPVSQDIWSDWLKRVPQDQRDAAEHAGRSQGDWHRPTDNEALVGFFRVGYGQKL